VAARVDETLDEIGRLLIEGTPRPDFATLARMRYDLADGIGVLPTDGFIGAIESPPALRTELTAVHAARASLRRQVLSRLIRNQEINP